MLKLDPESLKQWAACLPPYLEFFGRDTDSSKVAYTIENAIKNLDSIDEVIDYVYQEAGSFIELERAGRIRFLSWLADSAKPSPPAIPIIVLLKKLRNGGPEQRKLADLYELETDMFQNVVGQRKIRNLANVKTIINLCDISAQTIQTELR
ncbi:hypothetical protein [Flexibacterium corallicola]|uniref:hypothetical protein n=1 Tax=Flexibacterium corallicola TaxID=3037259 RepID=UPI00286F3DC7|nr:hypothetical protein [Pseudovibrio sp. M1P-2-3]